MMTDLRDIGDGLRSRIDRAVTGLRRATPIPLTVRGSLCGVGFAAMVLAWPAGLAWGAGGALMLVLAMATAIAPRSYLAGALIWFAVLGWLISTTAYLQPITFWRLAALACLLYWVHTLAALAAVLPYDAVVTPGALTPWLRRAGLVSVVSVAVALFALMVPVVLGDHRYLAASLVGLALVITFVVGLALLLRRRGDGHRDGEVRQGDGGHRDGGQGSGGHRDGDLAGGVPHRQ